MSGSDGKTGSAGKASVQATRSSSVQSETSTDMRHRPSNGVPQSPYVPATTTHPSTIVYGQINVYGVTTKSERHKRSYWTRTADGNGIGGRKAPVPYGS